MTHGFLHPAILLKSSQTAPLETLEFLFDLPQDARSARLEILEGTQSFEPTPPPPVLLLTIVGTVVNGEFQHRQNGVTTAYPWNPNIAANQALRIQIRGPRQATPAGPYDLHFPPAEPFWPQEGSVAELISRFTCEFDGDRVEVSESPVSVLVRQSDLYPTAGRSSGVHAVINGTGNYFTLAQQYWNRRADTIQPPRARTLRQLRSFLAPAQGALPWSEVSIVMHGNGTQALVDFGNTRAPNDGVNFIDEDIVADELTLGGNGIAPTTQYPSTRVVFRGCNIGRNQPLLDELRRFFACGQIVAPRFLQTYFQLPTGATSEGLSLRLYLYRTGATPAPLDLAGLAQALSNRYRPNSPHWEDILAICPHFGGLNGPQLVRAWQEALHHSERFLHGEPRATFPFEAVEYTAASRERRRFQGVTPRKLYLAHASAEPREQAAIANAVEASFREQWFAKEHPHATAADFTGLSFEWGSGTDADWTPATPIEMRFHVELLAGGFTEVKCLDFPDWHLVIPALFSNTTLTSIRTLQARHQANPGAPVPDVAFAAADRERLDWFLSERAGIAPADLRRRFAIGQAWQLGYTSSIRVTARTNMLYIELIRQTPTGEIMPAESFAHPFYGSA